MRVQRGQRSGTALVVLLAALYLLCVELARPEVASAAEKKTTCGTTRMFSHTFEVRVGGKPVGCDEALEVIDAPCKIRQKQEWSCFSFQKSYPFIVWFPTKELFEPDWSSVIIYKRYPCSEAVVTRKLFSRGPQGFPSRRQLLADDLIRCDLLEGKTYTEVKRMLGPSSEKSRRYLSYDLGLERDSIFQIDDEFLSIGFKKNGAFAGADIFQG